MPAERCLTLFCDGASRGNPGPGSYGYVIFEEDKMIAQRGQVLGTVTNNVAEYQALLRGIENCLRLGATGLTIKSDSQVLVRQLKGEYKVKAPHLQPLVLEARRMLSSLGHWEICHIPREENQLADALANAALDGKPL